MAPKYRVFNDGYEPVNLDENFLQHPCRVQISGPSSCGKTCLLVNLLLDPNSPWDNVIFYYKEWQAKYDQLIESAAELAEEGRIIDITFKNELPEGEEVDELKTELLDLRENGFQTVLVFDDLQAECSKNKFCSSLATAGVHHWGVSTIYLTQVVMLPGKGREQRLQLDYIVLFPFGMDGRAVASLFQQVAPGKHQRALDVFQEITGKERHAWMGIDVRCQRGGPEKKRLRIRANSLYKVFLDPDGNPPF